MKFWSTVLLAVGVCLGTITTGRADEWVVVPKEGSRGSVQRANGFSGGTDFFPNSRGLYNGLIAPTNEVVPQRSGYFRIYINSWGHFSGRFGIGDNTVPIRGWFNSHGLAGVSIYRRVWDDDHWFHDLVLTWTVELDLVAGSDEIQGTVINERRGGWAAALYGLHDGYATTRDFAPQEGRYTVRFPGSVDAAVAPPGDGYATVTVNSFGLVNLSGMLPDGVKIADSAYISVDGLWPLYVPLNAGDGLLFGWLRIEDGTITGDITWSKAARSDRVLYPNGFEGTVSVTGGRYRVPPGSSSPFSWNTGQLQIADGDIGSDVLANDVEFRSPGRLIDNGGDIENLKTKVNSRTGVFSGSFLHPVTGRKTSFAGGLFQFEDAGGGYFLGTTEGGAVRLIEAGAP